MSSTTFFNDSDVPVLTSSLSLPNNHTLSVVASPSRPKITHHYSHIKSPPRTISIRSPSTYRLSLSNDRFLYECGLCDLITFTAIVNMLSSISSNAFPINKRCMELEDQVFLFLFKLRHNHSYTHISNLFNVSTSTCNDVFHNILSMFDALLGDTVQSIPPPNVCKNATFLPNSFKASLSNVTAILDCTDFPISHPRSRPELHKPFYSSYRGGNTFKTLITISPCGTILHVTPFVGGSTSDKEIVSDPKYLKCLSPGHCLLCDKGFLIDDILPIGVTSIIPAFKNTDQFTQIQALRNRTIAVSRVHVERVIGKLKNWKILDYFPPKVWPYTDQIIRACSILTNLSNPVMSEMNDAFLSLKNNENLQ